MDGCDLTPQHLSEAAVVSELRCSRAPRFPLNALGLMRRFPSLHKFKAVSIQEAREKVAQEAQRHAKLALSYLDQKFPKLAIVAIAY